jgi:2-polyprenyl-6-methoxyphenol hydroxylase-like FAD-dependent oxidoreductase
LNPAVKRYHMANFATLRQAPIMERTIRANERFGGRRAIVLGGSMAGLLATRVLSDHFDEVVLVERDKLSDSTEARKGVPQGRQLHGLLKRGVDILDELFPDLSAGLLAGGGQALDVSADFRWHHFGVEKARFVSGITAIMTTRPFLEGEVRRRVLALERVRCRDERHATGFITSGDRSRITGVRLQSRGSEGAGAEEELLGDLIVDASGRGSLTPKWLEQLGYGTTEESIYKVDVGYATRLYRRPEPANLPYKAIFVIGSAPESRRMGLLFPVEDGQWMSLVCGMLGDHPPSDPQGYLEFARSLPCDAVHEAIKDAEPLSDVALYKFSANRRRHYERLERFPEALAVLGDSLCSFNPIYGQGMTTAGLVALALDGCLREQRRGHGGSILGLSRRFRVEAARVTDDPWMMAATEDFRYPELQGKRPFGQSFMEWYLGRIHKVVERDITVAQCFLRVMHMLEPPTALLAPTMIARVLAGGFPRA